MEVKDINGKNMVVPTYVRPVPRVGGLLIEGTANDAATQAFWDEKVRTDDANETGFLRLHDEPQNGGAPE